MIKIEKNQKTGISEEKKKDAQEYDALRKTFLALIIITGFIFIVSFSVFYVFDVISSNNTCGCLIPIPVLIIILSSLGLFIGSLTFYILSNKRPICHDQKKLARLFFSNLDPDERSILRALKENPNGITQTTIQKNTSLNKVKVHRLIKKMHQKRLILFSDEINQQNSEDNSNKEESKKGSLKKEKTPRRIFLCNTLSEVKFPEI